MTTRRQFFRAGALATGGLMFSGASGVCADKSLKMRNQGTGLVLRFKPYNLQLKHVFTISGSSRTTTPVVLVELEWDGVIGYGEASLPPYLGESQESVVRFLSGLNLSQFKDPFLKEDILMCIHQSATGNYAAKASVDIALHDLIGKLMKVACYKMWGLNADKTPCTSFTIGMDVPEVVKQKVVEASPYSILKVKLDGRNDRQMIETIRSVTDKPLCVDVNQGWRDRFVALDSIHWLKEQGVVFVEQPMNKFDKDSHAWLSEQSPLPIIADEAVQTLEDVLPLKGVYSGINIKLMKCGGLHNAYQMMKLARLLDMKVMIGCMTETSCAVSAAAQLSPLVDWADLDGNLLIDNDLFDGVTVLDGRVMLQDRPGVGVILR